MLVALPAGSKRIRQIGEATLTHFSDVANRGLIISNAGVSDGDNCDIHLRAVSGYKFDFWKLIRDLTVVDVSIGPLKTYSCYLYFFIGRVTDRMQKANVQSKSGLGLDRYEIKGSDIISDKSAIFYRPVDRVVVLRGDYSGPAKVTFAESV